MFCSLQKYLFLLNVRLPIFTVYHFFYWMCIPQRMILGTGHLTLWFPLNVCCSTFFQCVAKFASQWRATLSLQLLVVGLSTLKLRAGLERSKAQTLTKVVIVTEVIHITYTHTWLNSGTQAASVPKAAAPSLGWGKILSSWFFPSESAPSIDKGPQATTSQPKSRKGNGTLSSCFAYLKLYFSKRRWP